MNSDRADAPEREPLSPKTLTERITDASEGDTLLVNDHDDPLEVVDTDRYSITLVDAQDNEYTIAQNLQTGEWNVHQPLWWVQEVDES